MEYLLVMAFSGSTMTVIYLAMRKVLKNKVSARLYYLLARAAVLYYLIPLPFLKDFYRKILYRIMPSGRMGIVQTSLIWTKHVVYADGKRYVSAYTFLQAAAAAVWLLVVCFLMAGMLLDYRKTSRVIMKCADKKITDSQRAVLTRIKEQYGVKQPVDLGRGYAGVHTMTLGVYRPFIVCDRDLESPAAELLVSHEMVHIKRLDVLWKILLQSAAVLHWWNPLMRSLRQDFECICECSCDEIVMQGKSEEEIRTYRVLLAEQILWQEQAGKVSLRWKTGFMDNRKEMKERVSFLKAGKCWNRLTAWMLAAVLTIANSMTVFAYRDTLYETAPVETSQEEIESILHSDRAVFVPDSTSEEEKEKYPLLREPEILYERQFTDEEGTIYRIPNNAPVVWTFRAGNTHTYVTGMVTEHVKNPDGSCTGITYRARRCDVCDNLFYGQQISSYQYMVCPHDNVKQETLFVERDR